MIKGSWEQSHPPAVSINPSVLGAFARLCCGTWPCRGGRRSGGTGRWKDGEVGAHHSQGLGRTWRFARPLWSVPDGPCLGWDRSELGTKAAGAGLGKENSAGLGEHPALSSARGCGQAPVQRGCGHASCRGPCQHQQRAKQQLLSGQPRQSRARFRRTAGPGQLVGRDWGARQPCLLQPLPEQGTDR